MQYLKYGQIKKEYPLFELMGKNWFLKNVKSGKLKSLNTSGNPIEPRYVVERGEIEKFIRALQTDEKKVK